MTTDRRLVVVGTLVLVVLASMGGGTTGAYLLDTERASGSVTASTNQSHYGDATTDSSAPGGGSLSIEDTNETTETPTAETGTVNETNVSNTTTGETTTDATTGGNTTNDSLDDGSGNTSESTTANTTNTSENDTPADLWERDGPDASRWTVTGFDSTTVSTVARGRP